MGNGFQFIDIILFGMIAVFLVFRLRNTLGRRDGHEGGFNDPFKSDKEGDPAEGFEDSDDAPDNDADDDNVVHLADRKNDSPDSPDSKDQDQFWADEEGAMENAENAKKAASPDPDPDHDEEHDDALDDALANGMIQIQMIDRGFDSGQFVDGARMAFEMILNAYAGGDTATLKNLLSSEVYGNFSQAIKEREQAGEVLEDTLVEIKRTDYLEAYVESRQAFLTIKFVTDQVNVTRDENGDVVDGNPNEIITVTDIWTFSRDTRSRDPNWSLVATSSLD